MFVVFSGSMRIETESKLYLLPDYHNTFFCMGILGQDSFLANLIML